VRKVRADVARHRRALDDEFYEYPDDLARLLQRYVLEHREHFEETI
jgi:hypothetical protein